MEDAAVSKTAGESREGSTPFARTKLCVGGEMEDTADLKSADFGHEGPTPSLRTKQRRSAGMKTTKSQKLRSVKGRKGSSPFSDTSPESYVKALGHAHKMIKTKKQAQEFLISTGIYTKTGRLSKNYR
jgi:hypothetical protein